MPSLIELDAKFLRRIDERSYKRVDDLALAQGVIFLCPKCFIERKGPVGTHSIICWSRSRGIPDDQNPGPGRWSMVGAGIGDLTLNADPPSTARSVSLTGGCAWHGYVTNGMTSDA